jgi:hypothetical protein
MTDAAGVISGHEIRLLYGMIITRAVNGEAKRFWPCRTRDGWWYNGQRTGVYRGAIASPNHPYRNLENKNDTPPHVRPSQLTPSFRRRWVVSTGLVEQNQTGFYAASINRLAQQMGLPQWLVDLRHQATHNQVQS